MPFYLCISVRFLDGAFHGRKDSDEPEWPPSPLRLFQALVAAAAARERGCDEFPAAFVPALEFLQALNAPTVVAPLQAIGTPFRVAVPNNDQDMVARAWARHEEPRKATAELKTMKTIRPTRLSPGATVHYLWKLSDAVRAECDVHKDALFAAARSTVALGWGIDMVVGQGQILTEKEADGLRGERWRPVESAGITQLRVPQPGTLTGLIARHRAFLNRLAEPGVFLPVPQLSDYRTIDYRRTTDIVGRPFAAFVFHHPEGEKLRSFPLRRAEAVARVVRSLVARVAQQAGHSEAGADPERWVNEYVLGHSASKGSRSRFSYLPLPSIRPPGVVIGISRVMIAEPVDGLGEHVAWAGRALAGQFVDGDRQDSESLLVPVRADDQVVRRYVGPSDTWATVTPVVLPGSDDRRASKAEKLLAKALHHAGYAPEALAEWEFRNVSFWPGGDLAMAFDRPDYLKEGHWSVYHVRLRWRQAIGGPLALGAGRHCGLGVFAAFD